MNQQNTWVKLTFSVVFGLALFFNLGLTSNPDTIVTAESMPQCILGTSTLCYHNFDSTTVAATTADSDVFSVSGCSKVSIALSPPNIAEIQVYQCPKNVKDSTCTVFTHDKNADGRIDEADASQTITGSIGRLGVRATPPSQPNMYIDALGVPGSSIARVSVMCNKR